MIEIHILAMQLVHVYTSVLYVARIAQFGSDPTSWFSPVTSVWAPAQRAAPEPVARARRPDGYRGAGAQPRSNKSMAATQVFHIPCPSR